MGGFVVPRFILKKKEIIICDVYEAKESVHHFKHLFSLNSKPNIVICNEIYLFLILTDYFNILFT